MPLRELDSLVEIGKLKLEVGTQAEVDAFLHSGRMRLGDALNDALAPESRFDLAYSAAHALSLAALRWHGYRSENRYIVFQVLPHTLGLGPDVWRVLAKCYERRNAAEYEGHLEVDEQLLNDLFAASKILLEAVAALGPVPWV